MQAPNLRAPGSDLHNGSLLSKALGRLGSCLTASSAIASRVILAIALLAIFGQTAKADVVFQTSGGGVFPGAGSGAVAGVNIASGTNFIVVGVHIRGTSVTDCAEVASVTYSFGANPPLNFSPIERETFVDPGVVNPQKRAVRTEMWGLVNPYIGNGGTITVTLAAGAGNPARFLVGYTTYSGVNPSHPIRNACKAEGKDLVATLNFGTQAGDLVLDALSTDDTAAPEPVTGQILRYDLQSAFGANGIKGRAGTKIASSDGCTPSCPLVIGVPQCTQLSYDLGGLTPFVIIAVSLENALAPSAVEFESFSATQYKSGDVVLEWNTGAEINSLGFKIYKDENGVRTRVTPDMIAGSALQIGADTMLRAGRSYLWADKTAKRSDVQYWIEEIDLNGKSNWHGPVAAERSNGNQPKRGNAKLLSAILASQGSSGSSSMGPIARTASIPTSGTFSTAAMQILANVGSQNAAKIQVKQEGWYRISQAQLVGAGISANVDPTKLQLFVDGQEIPMIVNGEKDRKFESSDSIEFYGLGLDTTYTDSRVYWVVAGTQAGKRVGSASSRGGAGIAGTFPYTVERKDRIYYLGAVRNLDAENFFGELVINQPTDQVLTLQNVAQTDGTASIEITMQAVSKVSHNVAVSLNDMPIGNILFDGFTLGTFNAVVPQSLLREGANVVRLIAQNGLADYSFVGHIRVTYAHTYKADNNVLRFSAPGAQQVTIDGFTSGDVRLVDITDAGAVQEVRGSVKSQGGVSSITVTVPGAGERLLLAFTDGQAKNAAGISQNQPSNWRSTNQGADLIMITRGDLAASLGSLKSLRQSQGLAVATVDIQDIYDEFGFGHKTPYAVKDFLAYAKTSWKKAPQFVLLAGGASFDPRNYLGLGDYDVVPTKMVDTQVNETASDDWFADFSGRGLPELAIGRLPGRSAAELAGMVSKVVSYDSSTPSETALLVSDRNDGFDYEAATATIRSLLPETLRIEEINRSQLDDGTARAQLLAGINQGQKLINYAGHGSYSVWRGNILTTSDAGSFENASSLSLFVSMTCQNGFFVDPRTPSLAEALLKGNGGAVAVWASSGMTSPNNQATMNQEVIRQLFSGGTIGQAMARAKASMPDFDVRQTWILFGDPSARIR